uniref:Uncharacterized protein n=1 Tax=Anopheles coluzzii TaxID=1518534 RepID=A0A8W7PB39_ANOCL
MVWGRQGGSQPKRIQSGQDRSIPIGKGKQENTITTNVLILVPSLPPPSTCSPLPALHGIVVTGIELVAAPFAANFRLPEQWQDADAYLALVRVGKAMGKAKHLRTPFAPNRPNCPERVPNRFRCIQHGIVFASRQPIVTAACKEKSRTSPNAQADYYEHELQVMLCCFVRRTMMNDDKQQQQRWQRRQIAITIRTV